MLKIGEQYSYKTTDGEVYTETIEKNYNIDETKLGRSAVISMARSILATQLNATVTVTLKTDPKNPHLLEQANEAIHCITIGGNKRYSINIEAHETR